MDIQLEEYKKLKSQEVSLNQGINLLVGTNGSGKSSFLEYLFKSNIGFERKICFSSGINESFSSIYNERVRSLFRELRKRGEHEFGNSVLFFDSSWVPWLILFASYRKEGGLVNSYLLKTSKRIYNFKYQLKVPRSYLQKIQSELSAGEADLKSNFLINSRIHQFLNDFLPRFVDLEENHEKGLSHFGNIIEDRRRERLEKGEKKLSFKSEELSVINPYIKDYFNDKRESVFGDIYELFSLLTVAISGPQSRRYFNRDKIDLIFMNESRKEISLNHLSDGEYQMLSVLALLDLFDKDGALFLLDELDSHIHSRNLNVIWDALAKAKSSIVTSSHNVISIAKNDFSCIRFLENGRIISDNKKKSLVLETIHGKFFAESISLNLFLSVKNLILIDGFDDWTIYLKLLKKLGIDTSLLEKESICYPVPSDFPTGRDQKRFGEKKIQWIEKLTKMINKEEIGKESIRLKNIYLLCDRDEFDFDRNCKRNDAFKIPYHSERVKKTNFKRHTIIWNRREIENYLLSKKALVQYTDAFLKHEEEWLIKKLKYKPQINENKGNLNYLKTYIGETAVGIAEIKDLDKKKVLETVDCKNRINLVISDSDGLNNDVLDKYIKSMDKSDIDDYLRLVYEKLISEI